MYIHFAAWHHIILQWQKDDKSNSPYSMTSHKLLWYKDGKGMQDKVCCSMEFCKAQNLEIAHGININYQK